MKIHQLPQGARFEYEGEEYVKTGPMSGTGKGGPRFIPKYAVLTPLDEAVAAGARTLPDPVSKANVIRAFDAFCAECARWVPAHQRAVLDANRARFLKALD